MRKQKSFLTRGFTLFELALSIAVIATLAVILYPKGVDALRNSRVQQVSKTIETLRTSLTNYLLLSGGNGSFPRTEGTGIPCSGAVLSGASDAAKANGARLDAVLLATGILEKPIHLRMGSQSSGPMGSGGDMTWNQALFAFVMNPDAVPQRNWSNMARIEARLSTPGVLPSLAQGANFRLDGEMDRPANVIIASLEIPSCPYADAFALATQLNGPQLSPSLGAASDAGFVSYAAPVNGITDVHVYLMES